MIKGILTGKDGGQILFIGLRGENVARLVAQKPITFLMDDLKVDPNKRIARVVVVYGRTDLELVRVLTEEIGINPKDIHTKIE